MRRTCWFCLVVCGGLMAGRLAAESLDFADPQPKAKPPSASPVIPASVMEKSPEIAVEAKKDLIISPSGASPVDPVDTTRNVDAFPLAGTTDFSPETFDTLIKTAEMTMDNALPVLEAGQVFMQGIGETSFKFVGLEETLKQVLEEAKESQRTISITSKDAAALAKEVASPGPDESGADADETSQSSEGMGGAFGVGLIVVFAVVFALGVMVKS